METHRTEREQRDATRKAAWESAARNEGVNRNMQGMNGGNKKSTLADRAKYQFEADSEDDEMENEIDSNLGTSNPTHICGLSSCICISCGVSKNSVSDANVCSYRCARWCC
jgi:hypothetical protein